MTNDNLIDPIDEALGAFKAANPSDEFYCVSDEWLAELGRFHAEEKARKATERAATLGTSVRELQRQRSERSDKQKKKQDLQEQALRLAKRCRLGRRVTLATLNGKTENQLRLIIGGLQTIADDRAREELERMTPEQEAAEREMLRRRKMLHERHLEAKSDRRTSVDSERRNVDEIWAD